jgi:predicted dienelactone hydrolase
MAALQEAVVDDSDPKYPVVIFSHGLGGCRSTYSILCAELASQVTLGVATGPTSLLSTTPSSFNCPTLPVLRICALLSILLRFIISTDHPAGEHSC